MSKILSKWPFLVSGALVGGYAWLTANDEWLISKIVRGVVAVAASVFLIWLIGDFVRHMVTKHGDNDVA